MKLGNVRGSISPKQCISCLAGETVLLVELEGAQIAAVNRAGARPGDRVLVATGPAAGRYSMEIPADAVVVAVVND